MVNDQAPPSQTSMGPETPQGGLAAATRILIVEDDGPIRRFLQAALTNAGYEVAEAETGRMGLTHMLARMPDLVVLDLGLPDMDGMEIISQVREWSQVPIIVLSARGREGDKVEALNAGADDYLTKPFGVPELLARIRVALRHAAALKAGGPKEASRFQVGDLVVDLAGRHVFVREVEVHLTPLEYRLLTTLVRNAGKVLTHRYLLREVWGPGYQDQTHYPRMFVASLRRKLEDDPAEPRYVLTEQGVGYRLVED
jgi:two-component system, OmpR family, KDP operon response regulator KdpE